MAGSRELKGSNSTLSVKKYFYQYAEKSKDWHVYAIILDKHKYKNKIHLLPREYEIYNYLSKAIIEKVNLQKIKLNLLLIADRKSKFESSEFNKYLSAHFDAILPKSLIYDIRHEDSSKNVLLQSVDLFSWGVWKSYEHCDDSWTSVFKSRLTVIEAENFLEVNGRTLQSVVLTF